MLSPQLRRKVHDLWSLFWSSGLSNSLVANSSHASETDARQIAACDSYTSPIC